LLVGAEQDKKIPAKKRKIKINTGKKIFCFIDFYM
jgi:hypothetical protein